MLKWGDRYPFVGHVKRSTLLVDPGRFTLIVTSHYPIEQCFSGEAERGDERAIPRGRDDGGQQRYVDEMSPESRDCQDLKISRQKIKMFLAKVTRIESDFDLVLPGFPRHAENSYSRHFNNQ
jgi:hypothetical protein